MLRKKLERIKENFRIDNKDDIEVWVFYDKSEKVEKISNNGHVYKYRWPHLSRQYNHIVFGDPHDNVDVMLYSFFKDHTEFTSYYVYDACCNNVVLFKSIKYDSVKTLLSKYSSCVRKPIMNKIVVTMTTWRERISNCLPIIKNIIENQTLKPDMLFLNISEEEHLSLPDDLTKYFNNHENCILNIVPGKNTKVFKKVFPILGQIEEDDVILCIDDDIMYPKDYIESRVNDFVRHGCSQPISGHTNCAVSFLRRSMGINPNYGGGALFQKKMLRHYEDWLDDEVLKTNNDDTLYTILEYLNGYVPQDASKYHTRDDLAKNYSYNETSPSKGNLYSTLKYVDVYKSKISKLIGKPYSSSTIVDDILGYYNKKQKIVVTMTSWKQRVHNCGQVIDSVLEQSLTPDQIYVNLSVEEFPNKEDDLPYSLMRRVLGDQRIIINWVPGENTKTYKKVFPILKYLNDDDLIFYMDDDEILPKDILKSRINDFKKHHQPISGTPEFGHKKAYDETLGLDDIVGSTACSLVQAKMLKGFDILSSSDLIHQYNDDTTYVMLCYLNGYKYVKCSDYPCYIDKNLNGGIKTLMDDVALSKEICSNGNNYYKTSCKTLEIIKTTLESKKDIALKTFNPKGVWNVIKPKICVYSNVLNNKLHKKFQKIEFKEPNVDYIMMTDDQSMHTGDIVDGWKILKVSTPYPKVQDNNKYVKWNPWKTIDCKKYDYSIYVDSKVMILKSPTKFVLEYMDKIKYGFSGHSYKFGVGRKYEYGVKDIYNHIDYLIEYKVGGKENMLRWKDQLERYGYPKGQGIMETCVLLTDLKNEECKSLYKEIFDKYLEVNTQRDQIIVPYILWRHSINMDVCTTLGDYYNYSVSGYFKNNQEQNVNGRC